MREEQKNFFDIMHSFRKLNLSSMLPGISHGELGVLKMIQHCQRCSGVDQGGGESLFDCERNASAAAGYFQSIACVGGKRTGAA